MTPSPSTSHWVHLALGSNISPRRKYIEDAISLLRKRFPGGFRTSKKYVARAYQDSSQSDYLNCCVCFETSLSPRTVLEIVLDMEKRLGRVRDGIKWSARTIDIDILLHGPLVVDTSDLKIPHYDLEQRDFFIVPLLELEQTLVHPKTGKSLRLALGAIPRKLRTDPKIASDVKKESIDIAIDSF